MVGVGGFPVGDQTKGPAEKKVGTGQVMETNVRHPEGIQEG